MLKKCYFTKCAGAKCDLFKLDVRTRVRAHLKLDVRCACDPHTFQLFFISSLLDIRFSLKIYLDTAMCSAKKP